MPAGIAEIARAVNGGELSAVEVVADYLARAEATQPAINAFTHIDYEHASRAAAEVDARVARGGGGGRLAGVPIAVKDLIDHAGRPNTAGTSLPPPIPQESATVITRLEGAGAVIIGRTGLHEYAFGFSSENHWFGAVRNPWDTSLSPGGSSGGSAAAVAAGAAVAALGTDTGGSVRVPAAICGIVGLKVTHGRVPLTGVFPLAPSLDTVGPLTRTVEDAASVYLIIAGHDPADPWSAPQPVVTPQGSASLRQLTLGIPHPWVDLPQTGDVADGFASIRKALTDRGAKLIDLDLPDLVPASTLEDSVYPEVAAVHNDRWQHHPESYGPDVAQRMAEAFDTDPIRYVRAQEWRARIRHVAQAALESCDALMTPTVAANRKPIGDELIDVAGKMVSFRPQLSRFTALVNHTGMPALALPLQRAGKPPPSVQLIGRRWEEHRLLEIGLALEDAGLSRCNAPHGSQD